MKKIILVLAAFISLSFSAGEGSAVHCYVRVTKAWRTANEGYTKGVNVLHCAKDTSGYDYVSLNAYNEFQELFDKKSSITLYWLYENAFVKDTVISK